MTGVTTDTTARTMEKTNTVAGAMEKTNTVAEAMEKTMTTAGSRFVATEPTAAEPIDERSPDVSGTCRPPPPSWISRLVTPSEALYSTSLCVFSNGKRGTR